MNGFNDDLNGAENPPISFSSNDQKFEIVQSLAKWKRWKLSQLPEEQGIIVNMTAIRPSEKIDDLHQVIVKQWDWELKIHLEDRTNQVLEKIANTVYQAIQLTAHRLDTPVKCKEPLFFISSEDLRKLYPDLTPSQREFEITKKFKAVFVKQVGKKLSDGTIHDKRAPDYDDWDLNGDIICWHEGM